MKKHPSVYGADSSDVYMESDHSSALLTSPQSEITQVLTCLCVQHHTGHMLRVSAGDKMTDSTSDVTARVYGIATSETQPPHLDPSAPLPPPTLYPSRAPRPDLIIPGPLASPPPGRATGGLDDKKTTHVGNEEDRFTDGTKKGMKYTVNAAVANPSVWGQRSRPGLAGATGEQMRTVGARFNLAKRYRMWCAPVPGKDELNFSHCSSDSSFRRMESRHDMPSYGTKPSHRTDRDHIGAKESRRNK
ncbi:unnamed protein product [Pleuronectes platessa]|uniref:Uncharacterized protein n=1 Tax=Pleuronectes platessa TaxID=8262 RepID=A0A9N7V302_PLEPL|nr:unnamed protein product [Pleuronectes platessa]